MKNIQPSDYQLLMLRRIEVERAMLSGWTLLMTAVIRSVKVDGGIWVIAHRMELVEQMKETLTRFGNPYKESKDKGDWGKAKVGK